jgi:hypothetical protein
LADAEITTDYLLSQSSRSTSSPPAKIAAHRHCLLLRPTVHELFWGMVVTSPDHMPTSQSKAAAASKAVLHAQQRLRQARLAEELRANLKKRKTLARAKAAGADDAADDAAG